MVTWQPPRLLSREHLSHPTCVVLWLSVGSNSLVTISPLCVCVHMFVLASVMCVCLCHVCVLVLCVCLCYCVCVCHVCVCVSQLVSLQCSLYFTGVKRKKPNLTLHVVI